MKRILLVLVLFFFTIGLQAENRIVISKKDLTLYVLTEEGEVLYRCKIACGKRKGNKTCQGDDKTPEGEFSVLSISDSRTWLFERKDGVFVPHVYGPFFIRLRIPTWKHTIGIHGTSSPRSIGTRASMGCIRCHNEDIVNVVKYVKVGAPVTILPDFT